MRNPTRRSRNIGRTQGGRVSDGRSDEKPSRIFTRDVWQKLSEESPDGWRIIRENPSKSYYHPCTNSDIQEVLDRLPKSTTEYLKAVVLRRLPKLDEKLGVEARKRWDCIILNSFPRNRQYIWREKPEKSVFVHNEPWCRRWTEEKRGWVLHWTKEEIKRYYLYHFLLHELGHINQPWFQSSQKREEFAENFALEWAHKLGVL